MSSVYGFYSSSMSSSSSSTSLGLSGLVSGMDIESTVKAMSSGTSQKISKVQQNLMKLQWKQEAFQDVGTAMTDFKDKYLSSTGTSSISNLLKNSYSMKAESSEEDNTSAVSASGSAAILENFSILGVSQLATTASFSTAAGVTDPSFSSSAINFSDNQTVSNLKGKKLNMSVGGASYEITFGDELVKDDASLQEMLTNALNNAKKSGDENSTGVAGVSVSVSGGKVKFTSDEEIIIKTSGNSSSVLNMLGLKAQSKQVGNTYITPKGLNGKVVEGTAVDYSKMTSKSSFFGNLEGKNASVTFDLDGVKGTVKFDDDMLKAIKEAGKNAADAVNTSGMATDEEKEKAKKAASDEAMLEKLASQMESQLRKSFGEKIEVKADPSSGTFSLGTADNYKSSILSVASGSSELVGTNGLLGLNVGDANRLLTNKKLEEANFADGRKFDFGEDGKNTYGMEINGVKIEVGRESITVNGKKTDYKNGVTTRNIMDAINNSDANVKISYLSTTDRFNISSTVSGAAGQIEIKGLYDAGSSADGSTEGGNLAEMLLGVSTVTGGTVENGTEVVSATEGYNKGEDATMLVSFDGKTVEEITRSSNSFTLDGLKLNLKSTFNTDKYAGFKDGTREISTDDTKITFSKSVDSEALTEALKTMVEDYNNLISKVTDYYTTKGDKDYQPLTADMIKSENLNDDQAEMYNDKAKEGVLFGNDILRNLQNDLMGIFTGMSSIGISTSKVTTEYGKLSFDTSAFKAAADSDLEKISNMFSSDSSGVMGKLDSLMKRYVNPSISSPGLITREAGLASSKLTQSQSNIFNEMTKEQELLKTLENKKTTEEDRYYKRFTKMETAIYKAQSQLGYLGNMSF